MAHKRLKRVNAATPQIRICQHHLVWDLLSDVLELVRTKNPLAKLDHVKRELVAARFYEILAEAIVAIALNAERGED